LGFEILEKNIKTVYEELNSKGLLDLLKDDLIHQATSEIIDDKKKTRTQINEEIKKKENAIKKLSEKYKSKDFSSEDINLILYSISDYNSYVNFTTEPINKMIGLLKKYFSKSDDEFSLKIYNGSNGARLTHDHKRQYNYVLQSLLLWKEVTLNMYKLWILSEKDLFSEKSPYKLVDTGLLFIIKHRARIK
jgi:hypothetical protein